MFSYALQVWGVEEDYKDENLKEEYDDNLDIYTVEDLDRYEDSLQDSSLKYYKEQEKYHHMSQEVNPYYKQKPVAEESAGVAETHWQSILLNVGVVSDNVKIVQQSVFLN